MAVASPSVEPKVIAVAPGSRATGELRVRNDSPDEQRFSCDVMGEAASWVSVAPASVTLEPGGEGTVRIFVRPPRTSSLVAGRQAVTIRLRAERDRKQDIVATAEVEIEPFLEVSAALDARSSENRSRLAVVSIENRGNAQMRASIVGDVTAGRPEVAVDPSTVALEPGGRTDVAVHRAGRRRVVGSGREQPFGVVVTPDGGEPIPLHAFWPAEPMVRRSTVVALSAALALLLVAAVLRVAVFPTSHRPSGRSTLTSAAACPGAGHLAHDANGLIRHNVIEPDNYSFLFLQPGGCQPVRWNPCAAIHYVVNQQLATPSEAADTRQAVAEVSEATGIPFVFDGATTEDPGDRPPYDPVRYPGRWAPLLIDWTHLGGASSLTEVAGGGVPIEVKGVYVTGEIVLNLDAHLANNAPIPDGFGSGVTWGRIVLHELGHAMGLGHVASVDEIMHEPVTDQTSATSAYGFGDVAGLRLLGRSAGCLTPPPLPA